MMHGIVRSGFLIMATVLLGGCSLLGWDDLTAGVGGAGGSTTTSSATGSTTTGAIACVSDATATATSLALADGSHCYFRVHGGLQWGLAELDCAERYGGHLLTIEELDEFSLHATLYPTDCATVTFACSADPDEPSEPRCDDRAWIGARFEVGEPVWTSGDPWTWPETVFAMGEPNQRIDPIALRTESLIDERPAECPHPYICEVDP